MATCARDGCARAARADEFCSTYCARRHHGTLPYEPSNETKNRGRRIARLLEQHGPSVAVANEDAMTRLVAGSYGTGKRR